MVLKKFIFFFIGFMFLTFAGDAQNKNVDSLLLSLKNGRLDTNRANSLNLLSRIYLTSKPDSARVLATEALQLSVKLKNDKFIGISFLNLGSTYWIKGEYPSALENYLNSLVKCEQAGYKKGIAGANSGLGLIYLEQKEFEKALQYYFKALQINEEIGEMRSRGICLGNIANIYRNLHDTVKALDYSFKALEIDEKLGNKAGMAIRLGNIGNIYNDMGDHEKALEFKFRALKIGVETGDKKTIAINLGTIGISYFELGKYDLAEKYYLEGLRACDSLGLLMALAQINLGLCTIYEKQGKFELAFMHYKKYCINRDSISNEENTKKQTRAEMQYTFNKKSAADSIRNAVKKTQDDIRKKQEIQQQTFYTYGGVAGFVLMLIATGVSFRAYRQKQRDNSIISRQKEIVEEKQKEILDSIHYAKRIQKSLLPTEIYITKRLKHLKDRA